MYVVSAREFRASQGRFLTAARRGQSVLLTSRYGNFKITPITEEDTLTERIGEGLREVKLMEAGLKKGYSVENLLDEL